MTIAGFPRGLNMLRFPNLRWLQMSWTGGNHRGHHWKKFSNKSSFFDECFQKSGLCLTKVFKYVVFVWKKFSIFFKNIFFPQGCDCDPTAENPDRFCFHKMVFDFMQLMAIPWQLLIIQWQYHGSDHLLKMTLVKGVASLLLNWNHALSLQMYCQSWTHIFTKICLSS